MVNSVYTVARSSTLYASRIIEAVRQLRLQRHYFSFVHRGPQRSKKFNKIVKLSNFN